MSERLIRSPTASDPRVRASPVARVFVFVKHKAA